MAAWDIDWAWSLPLIVLTVVTHVLGLGVINERLVGRVSHEVKPRHLTALFVAVMAAAALMVTVPLAFEGAVWGLPAVWSPSLPLDITTTWTGLLLLAGLAPARMAASLAAPEPYVQLSCIRLPPRMLTAGPPGLPYALRRL